MTTESPSRIGPMVENVTEASLACLITMVQGNVLLLGLTHWAIATQTGLVAGAITTLAMIVTRVRRRWVIAFLLGTVTVVVDYRTHPGMIGGEITEALITGAGAGALSLLVGTLIQRRKATEASAAEV